MMRKQQKRAAFRAAAFEALEDRRLMSAGPAPRPGTTIPFDQAPTAVQASLTSLASTDSVTAPTSATTVYLGNASGVETYAIAGATSGRADRLTVDLAGDTVTAPTRTTATVADLPAAAAAEVTAVATAVDLVAPASTASVIETATYAGTTTYTVRLAAASSTSGRRMTFSVDADGNPVGTERLPLSVFSTAVQQTLTANAPSGATALTAASLVAVKTFNGVTTYSVTYKTTGVRTTVSVGTTGALADAPDQSEVEFGTLPSAAQAELQTLATADGVADTIDSAQYITAYDEGNGTTVYSARLQASATTDSGSTRTYGIALAVDQLGNPTVPPTGFGFTPPSAAAGGGDDGGSSSGTTNGSGGTTADPTTPPSGGSGDGFGGGGFGGGFGRRGGFGHGRHGGFGGPPSDDGSSGDSTSSSPPTTAA